MQPEETVQELQAGGSGQVTVLAKLPSFGVSGGDLRRPSGLNVQSLMWGPQLAAISGLVKGVPKASPRAWAY